MKIPQDKIVFSYKVVIIGPQDVGKTSLFNRYCFNSFDINTQETIGINFNSIHLRIQSENKKELNVINSIFDLAGHERFEPLVPRFINGANGALLVFDSINFASFQRLNYWYDQLIKNVKDSNIPKILIGSKSDMLNKTPKNKIVNEEFINKFVEERKINKFFYTSALENYNILEVFKELTDLMLKHD